MTKEPSDKVVARLAEYLPDCAETAGDTASLLREEKIEQAEQQLSGLAEGIEWSTRLMVDNSGSLERRGVRVDISDLSDLLTDFLDAIERGDRVELRDLLSYRLAPIYADYAKLFVQLAGEPYAEKLTLEENFNALDQASTAPARKELRDISLDKMDASVSRAAGKGYSLSASRNGEDYLLCSSSHPRENASQWASWKAPAKKSARTVLFGFGLGYRPRALMQGLSADSELLIIVPDPELFKVALAYVDCTDILEESRLTLHIGNDSDAFEEVSDKWRSATSEAKPLFLETPNYAELFPELTERYKEFVEERQT
jgi:hypothetical protein